MSISSKEIERFWCRDIGRFLIKPLNAFCGKRDCDRGVGSIMIYIREFEFFEDEGMIVAVPFGLEGATCGSDLQDAAQMASDWLKSTIEYELIRGEHPMSGTLGNAPQNGGKVIAIAVDCDLSRVDAVTAADAARILGVSSARVAQMCKQGLLTSWKDGSRRMVLRESVKARLADAPKAGRPSKALQA